MNPIEITAIWGSPKKLRKELDKIREARNYRKMLAIIWMIEGKTRKEILVAFEIDRNKLSRWIIRFNERGIEALSDKKPEKTSCMFTAQDNRVIIDLISRQPRDFGYQFSNWTLALLAKAIRSKLNKSIGISGLCKHLKRLNVRRVMPHSMPAKSDQKKGTIQERSEICNTAEASLGSCTLFRWSKHPICSHLPKDVRT